MLQYHFFFKNHAQKLVANGYGLACLELQKSIRPEDYVKEKDKKFVFKGTILTPNIIYKLIRDVYISVIQDAEKQGMKIEFIDSMPAPDHLEAAINGYIYSKFNVMVFLNSLRDKAMAADTVITSLQHKTQPIMLVGFNHYEGLDNAFKKIGITPKFVLVTQNIEKLRSDVQSGIGLRNFEEYMERGLPVVDYSKKPKDEEVLDVLGIGGAKGGPRP